MQVTLPLVMTVGVVMVVVGIVVGSVGVGIVGVGIVESVGVGIVVGRVGVGIVESFVERTGGVVSTRSSRRRNKCESSKIAQNENKFYKRIETIYTKMNIILDSVNAVCIGWLLDFRYSQVFHLSLCM